MASNAAQKKWRAKHRYVKTQLNVMARKQIHDELEDFAKAFRLRGKGEAVTFAAFVTRALAQRADYDAKAARMLDDFAAAYHRDRDMYAS
jgi:hypothetical protein